MVSAGYARILLRSLLAQQWVYLKGCRPIGGNQCHHLAAWDKQHLILATARIFMLGGWHAGEEGEKRADSINGFELEVQMTH